MRLRRNFGIRSHSSVYGGLTGASVTNFVAILCNLALNFPLSASAEAPSSMDESYLPILNIHTLIQVTCLILCYFISQVHSTKRECALQFESYQKSSTLTLANEREQLLEYRAADVQLQHYLAHILGKLQEPMQAVSNICEAAVQQGVVTEAESAFNQADLREHLAMVEEVRLYSAVVAGEETMHAVCGRFRFLVECVCVEARAKMCGDTDFVVDFDKAPEYAAVDIGMFRRILMGLLCFSFPVRVDRIPATLLMSVFYL
ncbi:hypothetical protein BC830DRAFT_1176061 [Chytriomyces sp. MP71]|nr:hypothetical protein BC830DRAFT_1176061 [Chytriomyces sp. MP71]